MISEGEDRRDQVLAASAFNSMAQNFPVADMDAIEEAQRQRGRAGKREIKPGTGCIARGF
jgi:hypothetical protein